MCNRLPAVLRTGALLLACVMLASCGGASLMGGSASEAPELSNPEYVRTPPPVMLNETGTQQVTADGATPAMIDTSHLADGYVGASCTAPGQEVRFRIQTEAGSYDHYLDNDGTVNFYSLSYGDGHYTFVVLPVLEGTTEAKIALTAEADVALGSEQAPFLVPSRMIHYDAQSQSTTLSYQVAEHASTTLEVIQQIYAWVADNITYDTEKATTVVDNLSYNPNPDDTIANGMGICYDYAALVAAMLRANGIPCKLIKGDVANGEGGSVAHAWNQIWIEDEGWITVEIEAVTDSWNRVDLTFAASGRSDVTQFVGDGENYLEMSQH